ncbi:MAG: D-ribose pyranase [Actinomycetaceae bacterium]|nr:D-ribose pyranase [Actinomycetaceae bacterium]
MKKAGILNRELSAQIARLGHKDTFAIADCGLPIPRHIPVVDLSVVFGVPRFLPVLQAILAEVAVEGGTYAEEAGGTCAETWMQQIPVALETTSHENLKQQIADTAFVIRTGEATPWANVILRCGVPF